MYILPCFVTCTKLNTLEQMLKLFVVSLFFLPASYSVGHCKTVF